MADRRPPAVIVAGPVLAERTGGILDLTGGAEGHRVRLVTDVGGPVLGGMAARAAFAASGAGARVEVAGIVGNDGAGTACRAALSDHGIGTSALATVPGSTGAARTLLEDAGDPETIIELTARDPGGADPAALAVVGGCRAGDALVLCGLTLGRDAELLDAAEDADLQIVGLLDPFPAFGRYDDGPRDGRDLARLDVAVVDDAGGGALADSGCLPASVIVVAGGVATWDTVRAAAPGSFAVPEPDLAAFAGRLAAALAGGDDRPEALGAAWGAALPGPRMPRLFMSPPCRAPGAAPEPGR